MAKYTGCQCIVCQNLFRDEDDIVVCPECGTPYHRSCYASAGHCVNTDLHAAGVSWQQQQDTVREKIGGKECPNCHHTNAPGAVQCEVCYTRLTPEESSMTDGMRNGRPGISLTMPDGKRVFVDGSDPTCGFPKDEEFEGERLEDVAAFVRDNPLYYLLNFKKFKETGKKLTMNLPALFFPHLYFAHRKMWLMALVTIVVSALLGVPNLLLNLYDMLTDSALLESMQELYKMDFAGMFAGTLPFLEQYASQISMLSDVSFYLTLALRLVLSLFANWLYYRFVLQKVKKIRLASVSEYDKNCVLRAEGGASFWNVLGALGIYFAVSMAVSCAVMAFLM